LERKIFPTNIVEKDEAHGLSAETPSVNPTVLEIIKHK
jgi:hypothetical protein